MVQKMLQTENPGRRIAKTGDLLGHQPGRRI
jgi:hypothetical protein